MTTGRINQVAIDRRRLSRPPTPIRRARTVVPVRGGTSAASAAASSSRHPRVRADPTDAERGPRARRRFVRCPFVRQLLRGVRPVRPLGLRSGRRQRSTVRPSVTPCEAESVKTVEFVASPYASESIGQDRPWRPIGGRASVHAHPCRMPAAAIWRLTAGQLRIGQRRRAVEFRSEFFFDSLKNRFGARSHNRRKFRHEREDAPKSGTPVTGRNLVRHRHRH